MAHVAAWKKDVVNKIEDIVRNHQTVAVVRVDRIPGVQLQGIRSNLRGKVNFMVAKQNLIKLALENVNEEKKGVTKLSDKLTGQAAILGTDLNPFTLYKLLKENTQPLPAKGGEEAPEDIVIQVGETPFAPGPIVGEFGKVGIPAAIDKGKVVIKKTTTPVKKGGTISSDLALMLTKLEIFPFEAGVVVDLVWEDGIIYEPHELDIDMDAYRQDLMSAASMAMNLAIFTAYMTPLTAAPIISKAHNQAVSLAVNAGILTKETTELILSKAYGSVLALASALSAEALDEELKALLQGAAASAQEVVPEEAAVEQKEEEPEDEAPPSEEEAMSGLGALFG
ncbi:MAG: 50S ribosomal protein L10 [Thermoplasmatota archaeon]